VESRNLKLDAALGLIVIGVIGLFVWLSVSIGGNAPRGAVKYVLLFDSALGLTEDNDVAVAGVLVGNIEEIGIEGRLARVEIAVAPDVKVHENAKAAVRAKSLLGEKYVDLDPGAEPARVLSPGATLANNVPTVEIDEVIRSVQQLVTTLNQMAPPLERAVDSLDKVLAQSDAKSLGQKLEATLEDTSALIKDTREIVAQSGGDLQQVLRVARQKGPAILTSLETAGKRADTLLAKLDPKTLEKVNAKVPGALDDGSAALKDMRAVMSEVRKNTGEMTSIMKKLDRQLGKLDGLDETALRKFLQVEGVRVLILPSGRVKDRLEELEQP
jgi:phospholipid/cholesterol/gamma-HCH transport system substrate-binding protein